MPLLSVVIATHNRPALLKKCLVSLVPQVTPRTKAEIIVIDNSPRKTARKVVRYFPKVQYYAEKQLGLSFARNTGWKKAKGKYIAYIDDDSIADEDWIRSIYQQINKRPKIQAFGGSYSKHSTEKIPFWFPPTYGTLSYGEKEKKLHIGQEWLSGTNMIFSKKILEKMRGFDPSLGMIGRTIHYGEETDFLIRLSLNKTSVYYDSRLNVSHLLAKRKINITWLIKDSFIRGIDAYTIQKKYPSFFRNKYQIKKALKIKTNLTQKVISCLQLVCYNLGKLYAIFT